MQVEKQLFPALRRYMDNPFFDGWTFNKTEIRTPEGGFAVGFSTDNAGRAEGWHPKISPDVDPVFYVLDEAKTIPDSIFTAVSRCTLFNAFITSSPGADSGTFYDCFHKNSSLYYKIRVKYEDCPHIEINDPGKAERLKKEYGEQSSFYRSAILGEFTDLDGQSVISRRAIMELLNNPPPFLDTGETCGGFDFAAGGDENVFAAGQGNRFFIADHWADPDTVGARGRFRRKAAELGISADRIFADGDGLGLPIIDDFRAEGFPVHSYRGGFPADDTQAFVNLRAQAWRALARAIEEKELILDIDEDTVEQLVAPASRRTRLGASKSRARRTWQSGASALQTVLTRSSWPGTRAGTADLSGSLGLGMPDIRHKNAPLADIRVDNISTYLYVLIYIQSQGSETVSYEVPVLMSEVQLLPLQPTFSFPPAAGLTPSEISSTPRSWSPNRRPESRSWKQTSPGKP